jgi:hypothetical protein
MGTLSGGEKTIPLASVKAPAPNLPSNVAGYAWKLTPHPGTGAPAESTTCTTNGTGLVAPAGMLAGPDTGMIRAGSPASAQQVKTRPTRASTQRIAR